MTQVSSQKALTNLATRPFLKRLRALLFSEFFYHFPTLAQPAGRSLVTARHRSSL